MKKVTTSLSSTSVNIVIEAEVGCVSIDLPVNFVSPALSMQIAAMITADKMLPYDMDKVEAAS